MNKKNMEELYTRAKEELFAYKQWLKQHNADFIIDKSYETAHKSEIVAYFESLNNYNFEDSKFAKLDYKKIKAHKGILIEYLYGCYLNYDNIWPNLFYWDDLDEFLFNELSNI